MWKSLNFEEKANFSMNEEVGHYLKYQFEIAKNLWENRYRFHPVFNKKEWEIICVLSSKNEKKYSSTP